MTARRPATPLRRAGAGPVKPPTKPSVKPSAKPPVKPPVKPSARPPRPAGKPPAKPARPPSRSSARSGSLLRPTTMLAAVLVVLSLLLAPSVRTWIGQRQQIAAERQQVQDLKRRVAELTAERQRWEDPAYVKAQAGERLNLVMPGQTRYTLLDNTGVAAPDRGPRISATAGPAPPSPPWFGTLWRSARMAGGTDGR